MTAAGRRGGAARRPPIEPPLRIEGLPAAPDGAAVLVRAGGRTLGRVDVAAVAALGLCVGGVLERAGCVALEAALRRRAAFDAGARLLARRARTRLGLERRLREDFGEEAAAAAVTRLAAYLDDRRFARDWVEARLRQRPWGPTALEAGLRREGVPPALAREEVARAAPIEAEAELAVRAARERVGRMGVAAPERLRARLWGYLSRRGFSGAAIAAALRQVLDDPRPMGPRPW